MKKERRKRENDIRTLGIGSGRPGLPFQQTCCHVASSAVCFSEEVFEYKHLYASNLCCSEKQPPVAVT